MRIIDFNISPDITKLMIMSVYILKYVNVMINPRQSFTTRNSNFKLFSTFYDIN